MCHKYHFIRLNDIMPLPGSYYSFNFISITHFLFHYQVKEFLVRTDVKYMYFLFQPSKPFLPNQYIGV